ncbi:MAG TPA: ABC transporter substrate-binding protein [Burkholderiales bacterium]|nr:ABC transporter substrate-binding protein [Burkholderiales bacterium]
MTQDLALIVFPGGFNLPIWAAQRQGFLEENGVRVTLTDTPSSTFQMQGLADGRFDIAMTALDNVVAYQEGQGEVETAPDADLFAFMGSDNGFLSVVGGRDVKSFADLKGRKLSVDALTTGYAFVLRELMARNGIAESDVTFERAGGALTRFQELLKGTHAATVLVTPFDLMAMAKGHVRLALARQQLGAYQGVVAASRRAWARENETALIGFIRAYRAAVGFLLDPANREIAQALLVAHVRAMTPALAQQSLEVLLDRSSGFFEDVRLDTAGMATVLALRSKFSHAKRVLADPGKYLDTSYRQKAFAQ